MGNDTKTILELNKINKSFPGVKALSDVSLSFHKGEVHGIVGENGAGKSTMMKILTGLFKEDSGTITLNEEPVKINSPLNAQNLGLSIIFQELNLVESLNIAENIFVGRLHKSKCGGVDWKSVNCEAGMLIKKVGLNIDPKTKVGKLSVAQKQMVEIAKALSYHAQIIIMDEPSATLTNVELENLFNIIFDLKKNGTTVIYISHRLDEIFKLCDRVSVLRDGQVISTNLIGAMTKEKIIEEMVGRNLENEFPKRKGKPQDEIVLKVDGLTAKKAFHNISFELHRGEILGIAGLVGSGRTEIVRAIFGADSFEKGNVTVCDVTYKKLTPKKSINNKIAFVTEDRKLQGLILLENITKNVALANIKKYSRFGFMLNKKEANNANDYIDKLNIKTPTARQKVLQLSGGNQQKVIIAKWLNTDADIIILDEPTRGIDVGAKYEIYLLINKLVDEGKSVIMISSEMEEVVNMSDRILVISDGELKGELSEELQTAENVLRFAILQEKTT